MRILPPLQPVKDEFPPEVIVVDSSDDECLEQNKNGIGGTVNRKNKPTLNKRQICKVF
jgi:hypothetical protein